MPRYSSRYEVGALKKKLGDGATAAVWSEPEQSD